MWKLFIAGVVFGFSLSARAGSDDDAVRMDTTDLSNAITAGFFSDKQHNAAFDELNCMRAKAPAGHTFAHCSVEDRIKMLAPFLQTGFDRNKMGPRERALFYAHILVESSFLTKYSETDNFSLGKCGNKVQTDGAAGGEMKRLDVGEMAMRDLIAEGEDSIKNKAVAGSKHSSQFGDFRGRGLIQLTRCDNYLSVLHYLNLQYRGKNPYWQPSWHMGSNQVSNNQLGEMCTSAQLDKMMDIYSQQHEGKMSLNLYGVIENPGRFGSPGQDFKDVPSDAYPSKTDKLNKAITGEQFMVDVALAYWKGRCNDDIKGWITNPKQTKSQWCPGGRSSMSTNEATIMCSLGCVKGKGSRESWDKRKDWYEKALECVK